MFYVLDGAGILFLQNENDNSAKKFTLLQNIKAGEVFNEENVIYSSPSSKFSFISTQKTTLFQFTKEEFEKNEFIDNESRNSIVSDYLSKKRLFKAKMEMNEKLNEEELLQEQNRICEVGKVKRILIIHALM